MKILVLASENPELSTTLEPLKTKHQVTWARQADEVSEALSAARPEVILSIKHSQFPGEAHKLALDFPSVRWFHVGGSGTEHLGSWDPQKVTVTNSAGVLAPFHAERCLAALLALTTGLREQWTAQRQSNWLPTRFQSLQGRTLLIVGVGHTGGALADLASVLNMTVIGIRESRAPHRSVQRMHPPEELLSLLGQADVVSLHLRAEPTNQGLLGAKEFQKFKPGAILLNAARGSLIDEHSLLVALDSGRLSGAWLDVFAREPLPANSPLWSHPKIFLSAHCADQVSDFEARFGQLFLQLMQNYPGSLPSERIVSPPL